MTQKIIYQLPEGGVAVLRLTGELSFEDCCKKDVPAGVPYLIVDAADIPSDRSFRNAWEADFSNPDGYGIGADAYFAAKEANQ
jgi:hypothetical protein